MVRWGLAGCSSFWQGSQGGLSAAAPSLRSSSSAAALLIAACKPREHSYICSVSSQSVEAAALAASASVALPHRLRLFPPLLFRGMLRLSSKRRLHDLQDAHTFGTTRYTVYWDRHAHARQIIQHMAMHDNSKVWSFRLGVWGAGHMHASVKWRRAGKLTRRRSSGHRWGERQV